MISSPPSLGTHSLIYLMVPECVCAKVWVLRLRFTVRGATKRIRRQVCGGARNGSTRVRVNCRVRGGLGRAGGGCYIT